MVDQIDQDVIDHVVDALVRGETVGECALADLVGELFESEDIQMHYDDKVILVNAVFKALQCKKERTHAHPIWGAVEALVKACPEFLDDLRIAVESIASAVCAGDYESAYVAAEYFCLVEYLESISDSSEPEGFRPSI